MSATDKTVYDHMIFNSEAPFFDCARFKSLLEKGKTKPGLLERLNSWCNHFTLSTKRDIFLELENFKRNAARQ